MKTCRVPPVWRGEAAKALEPAAYRRWGTGGQERLYGKPTTEKVLGGENSQTVDNYRYTESRVFWGSYCIHII